jgi:hypothetical protein
MNNNIFIRSEFMYLVTDASNSDAIILATGSATTAKAVALCDRRLRCRGIETWARWIAKEFKEFDFNDMETTYYYNWGGGKRSISVDSPSPVTDEFRAFRKEIKTRHGWHEALSTLCDQIMLPVAETPLHNEYASSIVDQIHKCDPANNFYTDAICAYATATNCSPSTAYNELNLHMENIAHARLRNLGIYIKYRNLLNSVPATQEAQRAVYNAAQDELVNNSLV